MKTKLLTSSAVILTIGLLIASPLLAYTTTERSDMSFDEALKVNEQDVYAFPEKIFITRVSGASEFLQNDPELWYKMLYYYYVTRLEMADIPFNYLVSRDGQVFQGRSGWPGVIPELQNPEGVVMIAYMSNGSDLTTPAKETLQELVEDLSYRYGIVSGGVYPVQVEIAEKTEGTLSKFIYGNGTDTFSDGVKAILPQFRYSSEDHYEISASVGEVTSKDEVELGEEFEVTVDITNDGETPWFTFNDYVYIVTADGKDSPFAVNQVWDSFDAPTHIEGATLFPEDSYEVKFKMKAPLSPGEYTQVFAVSRLNKPNLPGTEFTVSFSVAPGDIQLVEILDTPTGSLNVKYETPKLAAQGR